MTAISDIYAAIRTVTATALTGKGYTQIPNAYLQEENASILLTKGYGIGVGPGTNTELTLGCQRSFEREFSLFLTRQITTTDNNVTAREEIEKSILDDADAIMAEFEKNPTLSDKAATSVIVSDGGLEFLESEIGRYYILEMTITVSYFVNL